jgi:formiminoglutamase
MSLPHDPLWPRAGGWPNFDGEADATILGVPAWKTSISQTGAHATPGAIRKTLRRYSPTVLLPEPLDLNDVLRIADAGDIEHPDGPAGEEQVRTRVRELAAASGLVIALGGDNSITFPVAHGMDATGLITLDAHYDLRDGISNGSPVRRLVEEGGLDPKRIVQIGIADFANSAQYARRAADWGIRVITLDEVRERGIPAVIQAALAVVGDGPVHLDIDMDVCDRAVVPACPASVPGGLEAWELRALVRGFAKNPAVRSADIVEVDALADTDDDRTVRLASLCVLELLAGLAAR